MKKNKGFTLIELLGVIIVLGIIAVIIYPSIEGMLQDSRQRLYNSQIEMIENALEQYAVMYRTDMPKTNGQSVNVTLKQLVDSGLVEEGLENPLTKEPFKEADLHMVITRYQNNYTYSVN